MFKKTLNMNFNFDPLDICLTRPTEAFIKTFSFLSIGLGLDGMDTMHIPPIIMEIAKLLAYLGASVAFFKFVIGFFTKKETNKDEKE